MHPLWTMNVFLSSFFYFIFMLWFRFICHLRRAPWLSVVHTLSCILNLKRQLTETTARPVGNGMRNERTNNHLIWYIVLVLTVCATIEACLCVRLTFLSSQLATLLGNFSYFQSSAQYYSWFFHWILNYLWIYNG